MYVPRQHDAPPRVVVSVHGSSQRWPAQVATMVAKCDRENAVLVSPFMDDQRLPRYQRLGSDTRRSDLFLNECLREVGHLAGVDVSRIFLFGHSGGAQFVHRYAMAYPHRVHAVVAASAGWYTFPDTSAKFPYGIRSSSRLPGVTFDPEQYLQVPVHVLVGREDTGEERVRRNERVDSQQGTTRLERARRWVEAMRSQAASHSLPPLVELTELPGVGHSFESLCQDAALVERAFLLFHPATAQGVPNEA
jgi:poly(3-hydroxybutyrate) depolymerase